MPSPSAKNLRFAKIDKWPLEYFSHFEVKHVPRSTHTKHDDPAHKFYRQVPQITKFIFQELVQNNYLATQFYYYTFQILMLFLIFPFCVYYLKIQRTILNTSSMLQSNIPVIVSGDSMIITYKHQRLKIPKLFFNKYHQIKCTLIQGPTKLASDTRAQAGAKEHIGPPSFLLTHESYWITSFACFVF